MQVAQTDGLICFIDVTDCPGRWDTGPKPLGLETSDSPRNMSYFI